MLQKFKKLDLSSSKKSQQKAGYRIAMFMLITVAFLAFTSLNSYFSSPSTKLNLRNLHDTTQLNEEAHEAAPAEESVVPEQEEEADEGVCVGKGVDTMGALWLCIFVVFYMFCGLAIICDDFFVPALEKIGEGFDMSPDVTGATLMAMGGSAPEFFTALIGTFQESDVGFGTIVGSAVFNVLFVIGACIVFAKETLSLSWYPLTRDCIWYTVGLLVLSSFFSLNSPSYIEWYESGLLFVLYCGYVWFMFNNASFELRFTGKAPASYNENDNALLKNEAGASEEMRDLNNPQKSDEGEGSSQQKQKLRSMSIRSAARTMQEDDGDEPTALGKFFDILCMPLQFVFKMTIPDPENHMWLAFIISIIEIGTMTWFMVHCAELVGNTMGIPIVIMGITVLASGTSVPDLISSVIVARKGEGDMALSSSIGSNIFDILVGLPVPWFLYNVVMQKPVHVYSDSLIISILVLIGMEIAVILTIKVCDWKMNPKMGFIMFFLYILFLFQDLYRADWSC